MGKDIDENRTRLKATLHAKRISRLNLDIAYEKLEEYEHQHRVLVKHKKTDKYLETLIDVLKQELDRLEDNAANMCHGGSIEGGVGFGSGGTGRGDG